MKCKFNIFLLIIMASLLLSSCSEVSDNENHNQNQVSYDNTEVAEKKERKSIPVYITDLFDGDEKVWFYLEDDELAYNTKVSAVLVTKNKEVTSAFFSFGKDSRLSAAENANLFKTDRFMLSDFAGLSNKEIINKVKNTYFDAKESYTITYDGQVDKTETFSIISQELPNKITYSGKLDSSGNNLRYETIHFLKEEFRIGYIKDYIHHTFGEIDYIDNFYYASAIKPTIIKDKEYIGIVEDVYNYQLITENVYDNFGKLEYDSPEGATELD